MSFVENCLSIWFLVIPFSTLLFEMKVLKRESTIVFSLFAVFVQFSLECVCVCVCNFWSVVVFVAIVVVAVFVVSTFLCFNRAD